MKQPEALRLAEWSDWYCSNVKDPSDFRWKHMAESAAELRRLHAVEESARNLVKVKGRYHTEQAFNKLKELLT